MRTLNGVRIKQKTYKDRGNSTDEFEDTSDCKELLSR